MVEVVVEEKEKEEVDALLAQFPKLGVGDNVGWRAKKAQGVCVVKYLSRYLSGVEVRSRGRVVLGPDVQNSTNICTTNRSRASSLSHGSSRRSISTCGRQ